MNVGHGIPPAEPNRSLFSDVETWPCGCAKGMTPHGAGWSDCAFSNEQKAVWDRAALGVSDRWRCPECGDVYGRHMRGCDLA